MARSENFIKGFNQVHFVNNDPNFKNWYMKKKSIFTKLTP